MEKKKTNHYGMSIRKENNTFVVEHYDTASGQAWNEHFPTLAETIASIPL